MDGLLRSVRGRAIKTRLSELEAEMGPRCQAEFETQLRHQQVHDSLLDICVSAFGPQSETFQRLGFGLVTSEPLKERGLKSLDCLIYNAARKYAIFVECKSSISSPSTTLAEIREATEIAEREREYLQVQIGDTIQLAEYVLCAPAEEIQPVIRSMKEHEAADDQEQTPPLLLWQVNRFVGQSLQLVNLDFRPAPNGQHRDREFTRQLANGVRVDDAEVVSKVYPSSHPLRTAKEILTELMFRNLRAGARLQSIRKRDAIAFLSDPANLIHYAAPAIARDLYSRFERESVELGLLSATPGDDDRLEINVEGKTLKTVLRGFEREYTVRAVERMAKKRAALAVVAEFKQKQTTLPTS